MCGALGLLAVGGWKLAGLQYKEIAEVSSWQDAMALAHQQRVSKQSVSVGELEALRCNLVAAGCA